MTECEKENICVNVNNYNGRSYQRYIIKIRVRIRFNDINYKIYIIIVTQSLLQLLLIYFCKYLYLKFNCKTCKVNLQLYNNLI